MDRNIDLATVVIIACVILILYSLCTKRQEGMYGTYLTHKETSNRLLNSEPKFGPKQVMRIKQPCADCTEEPDDQCATTDQRPFHVMSVKHRGPHEARNGGYNPAYHGEKNVIYQPAWPNVADDYEVFDHVPEESLTDNNEFPVIQTSNKVDLEIF